MLEGVIEFLSELTVPATGERTPSWLGGAIVFGTMAAVIVGLWALARV